MSILKKHISVVVLTALLFNALPGPLHPVTCHAFSVGEEKEVGEKLLTMVRKSFHVMDDPDINQYVNEIGQRILAVAGPQYFDYHFFVISDKEFNAFAAPSGLIFIHSGLIEAMNSEGELISVMAHECAHVTSRHISDRINKSAKTNIGTAALLIAGIALGGGALSQALITGSMATSAAMNLKFSREDEEEADRLSYKWMQELKVDPANMETMLGKMYRISVYRTANIPPYLLTHPEPKQRQGYVQDLIMKSGPKPPYKPADDFSFLRVKQRVVVATKDPSTLRALYTRKAAEGTDLQSVMAQYGLALIAQAGADYAKAETLLKSVITAYPDRPILKTDLAALYMQSGRINEALPLLNASQTADPRSLYTKYTLAQALEQTGETKKALALYKNLLQDLPDHAMLQRTVGNLETKLGRKGVGHYYLGRYFWLEGDSKNAKYHLTATLGDPTVDPPIMAKAKTLLADIMRLEKDM